MLQKGIYKKKVNNKLMSLINFYTFFFFLLVDNMSKMIKLNYLGQAKK